MTRRSEPGDRPPTAGGQPTLQPTVAVTVLVHRDGRFLLHLRDDDARIVHPGRWGTFGGSIEGNEAPEACARRELLEETGLAVGSLAPLTIAVDRHGRGAVAAVFYAIGDFDPATVRLAEGRAVELFAADQLAQIPMVPFVRTTILDVLVPALEASGRARPADATDAEPVTDASNGTSPATGRPGGPSGTGPVPDGALADLAGALGGAALVTDRDIVAGYRADRSGAPEPGWPVAVVRATTTADVQETLRWASRYRVPVVPRGAGTGLAGGSTAVQGGLVLSTERMRTIVVDQAAGIAVCQPGALNGEVKAAAAAEGLWYPPDPSSFEICSIGGNVATNAGGACCVKYGVTTDYVLGLQVVLADGRAIRLGGRTVKDVAGYDLKRLFVGSEGTLGVVTEVILRLRPAPLPAVTVVATFPSVGAAGRAVSAIAAATRPSTLELMDATAVRAVEKRLRMGLDTECGALLVGRVDSGGDRGRADAATMARCCTDNGAIEVLATDDQDEGEQFMAARRMAIPAVERLGTVLIEDVGVPVPRVAELVEGVAAVASEHHTTIATIGHAGDGNFHPLVVFDAGDADAAARARRAFGAVMELALGLGGTITGEHGVGTLKRPWLATQLGDDVMALQHQVKLLLDPLGILNPGKGI